MQAVVLPCLQVRFNCTMLEAFASKLIHSRWQWMLMGGDGPDAVGLLALEVACKPARGPLGYNTPIPNISTAVGETDHQPLQFFGC